MKYLKLVIQIVCFIVFLIIVYLLFRMFLIYVLYQPKGASVFTFKDDNIFLKSSNTCNNVMQDFTMCIPEGFSLKEDFGKGDTVTYTDHSGNLSIIASVDKTSIKKYIKENNVGVDVNQFLDKYQFENNTDVLKFLAENQDKKFNLLSNLSDVKEYKVIWEYAQNTFPMGEVYFIEGDYFGFLIIKGNNYRFYLDYDGKVYKVSFSNSSLANPIFTKDNVLEYVKSIQFID